MIITKEQAVDWVKSINQQNEPSYRDVHLVCKTLHGNKIAISVEHFLPLLQKAYDEGGAEGFAAGQRDMERESTLGGMTWEEATS